MIITKESEIFQGLLKDVEYIKQTLKFSKYYAGCDPYIITEKDAKFKKGEWVIRMVDKDEPNHRIGRIFKILDICGSLIHDYNGITHWASSLRLASEEEIKGYLIQEAIKRGLTGWRKFKWGEESFLDHITTINPGYGYEYLADLDALTVGVKESDSRRAIYRNGEWAIPVLESLKKKLPKTKEGFIDFLMHFEDRYHNKEQVSMRTFLDDYED